MRILLVSHGLPPDSVGGVEQHVSGLADALVAQGHHVTLLARADLEGHAQGALEQTGRGNPTTWRAAYRWEQVDSLEAMYSSEPMAAAMARFLRERSAAGETLSLIHI